MKEVIFAVNSKGKVKNFQKERNGIRKVMASREVQKGPADQGENPGKSESLARTVFADGVARYLW